MAGLLTDFLAREAGERFVWGERDCLLFLADWVAYRHGVDPAAHMRGTYSTAAEADALADSVGGYGPMIEDCLRAVGLGWMHPAVAQAGDVGLIQPRPTAPLAGAVNIGGPWAARGPSGLSIVASESKGVWRICP